MLDGKKAVKLSVKQLESTQSKEICVGPPTKVGGCVELNADTGIAVARIV